MNKNLKYFFLTFLLTFSFARCNFINEANDFGKTAVSFFENLKQEKYDECLALMINVTGERIDRDTFKLTLVDFRKGVVASFGENYKIKLAKVHYQFGKNEKDEIINKATAVVQISNDEFFAFHKILLDDTSKKIIYIYPTERKYLVPNLTGFWITGLIGIVVVGFIIFSIVRVARSELKYKWIYYISIIVINFPTISYNAYHGLFIEALKIVFSCGVELKYSDYMNYWWHLALPVGALFANYKIYELRKGREKSRVENLSLPIIEEALLEVEEKPIEIFYTQRTYKCEVGNLVIDQEFHSPNVGEKVFLDNKPAPDGIYKVGFMASIEVENGIIISID